MKEVVLHKIFIFCSKILTKVGLKVNATNFDRHLSQFDRQKFFENFLAHL